MLLVLSIKLDCLDCLDTRLALWLHVANVAIVLNKAGQLTELILIR